ncbi:cell division protein FtsQ/DivIB [Oricola cellulosilytica]|uniref:Cell division protein FtsQ n=2 Tax=Oricola cellulosilytica TaxID=1429082 RepID=A0A4R0PF14_9HYPH|nr:cell division protein FtsQ/DivIB [Oricola cellulosilytica]
MAMGRDGEDRFVLPRLLRRPVRLFEKIFAGEIVIPRHIERYGLAAIFGSTALYGSLVGGQIGGAVAEVTAAFGFKVSEVEITGHDHTSEVAVFEALGLTGMTSLVTMNAKQAQDALRQLPWVETVSVRKVYPDTLAVNLQEKRAFAIWQTGTTLSLIEADGTVIGAYTGSGFNSLPLVVGPGAASSASVFMEMIAGYPELATRVKALIHVGERRWDVRLANGVTVKLPAGAPERAIERLLAMDAETEVLSRDIASIDLRLEDRTTVALTENAAMRREAALDAREKALRAKARSSI